MSALLPTPWEPVGNRSVRCAFEAGNADKPGLEVATIPMFLPIDEAERVSRLIAAAPALLAACQVAAPLVAAYKNDDAMWALYSQIIAALAKAGVQ